MKCWLFVTLVASVACAASKPRDLTPRARPLLALTAANATQAPPCKSSSCEFFRDVNTAVRREWAPEATYRRHDPHGILYEQITRVAKLRVVLDKDGALREASVAQSSGLDFLDIEAVAAFRRAAPFRKPPMTLLAEDETATFEPSLTLEFRTGAPPQRVWTSGESAIKKDEAEINAFVKRFHGRLVAASRREYAKPPLDASRANQLLQVRFTLRIDGAIEDATLLRTSGSPQCDQLILEAIRRAGGSDTPPDILFDENGHFIGLFSFRPEPPPSDMTFTESADAFLRRVERRVGDFWPPRHIAERYRPLPTSRRHFVIAHIVLDRYGTLVGSSITASSGKDDIDEMALEAIRKSAPFDNPPHTLVGPDGNIHFEHELFL